MMEKEQKVYRAHVSTYKEPCTIETLMDWLRKEVRKREPNIVFEYMASAAIEAPAWVRYLDGHQERFVFIETGAHAVHERRWCKTEKIFTPKGCEWVTDCINARQWLPLSNAVVESLGRIALPLSDTECLLWECAIKTCSIRLRNSVDEQDFVQEVSCPTMALVSMQLDLYGEGLLSKPAVVVCYNNARHSFTESPIDMDEWRLPRFFRLWPEQFFRRITTQ